MSDQSFKEALIESKKKYPKSGDVLLALAAEDLRQVRLDDQELCKSPQSARIGTQAFFGRSGEHSTSVLVCAWRSLLTLVDAR